MALLLMGVARLQALLPAPVVSYTTISPLLPEERFVSVARSGRSLRPGRYPASRSLECGLSSPPGGGATTWLTWGFHHNMFDIFLIGGETGSKIKSIKIKIWISPMDGIEGSYPGADLLAFSKYDIS